MKNLNNRPFEMAQIEITALEMCDIIVTSPTGPGAFPGEDDDFTAAYYWERNQ